MQSSLKVWWNSRNSTPSRLKLSSVVYCWSSNYCYRGAAVTSTVICMPLTLSLCLSSYWPCHVFSYFWLIVRKVTCVRLLCSALKTLKSKDDWTSKWQGHLFNCSGQLKTVCVGGSVKLQIMHLMTDYMAQKVYYFNAMIGFAKNKVTTDQLLSRWHTK